MPPSVELDELTLEVIVDNEVDTLSSVDDGVPQRPEILGLAGRVPVGEHGGQVVFDRLCCAGHGLSVLVTGRRGAEEHTVLFDGGPYGALWRDNAARLGVDLARVEAVFLSHWHFDHSGALPAAVESIAAARPGRGVVVDLHPDRPEQRGMRTPSGGLLLLPDEPSLASFAAAGGRVESHDEAHLLGNGFFFASGAIPRVTAYETGLANHETRRGGAFAPDPLILDERFLAAHVRGRGVTVLSACSHAGVVNACLAAREEYGGERVDVVLGGYHLAGKQMEPRIADTVRDLRQRIAPRLVAPGHCTGWRAKAALAAAFAPGGYAPSVVGSRYTLRAP
jgi:7,8-dihydropterin-6-yl-methyl-4-(beta-D-ribofuranosyl)aminobenzene 5'-phosphate synthase